jgi:hypothetical protein
MGTKDEKPTEEPGKQENPDAPAPEADDSGKEAEVDKPWDEERAKADLAKKNREAQNLRNRLKEAEEKAGKYDQLEDAKKSESEKLNEKAASLEGRATKAEQEAARLRVALKKGLTETQAKRLVGETEEELETDADELLADFQPKKAEEEDKEEEAPEADSKRRPKERLRPGAAPSAEPEVRGPKELASRVSHDW